MNRNTLIFTFCTPIFLGCNHLFFQPDQVVYTTPKKALNLDYQELNLRGPAGNLSYWVIQAKQPKVGTVLHFHGNAQNMTSHFLFVAWLTQFGFDVVTFDYRGYGKSQGQPTRAGVVADATIMAKHFDAQEKNLYILGQSLGAAVATVVVAQQPLRNLRALALDSPFASYRDIARKKLADFWMTWPLQYPLSFLVSDELSPVDYASRVLVPTTILHGENDGVVPLSEGQALYSTLGAKHKEFWQIAKAPHTAAFAQKDSPYRLKLAQGFCKFHDAPESCAKRLGSESD